MSASGEQEVVRITRRPDRRGTIDHLVDGQEYLLRAYDGDTVLDTWFVPDVATQRQHNAAVEGIAQTIVQFMSRDDQ